MKCTSINKTGARCREPAAREGLCTTHFRARQREINKARELCPALEVVPDPPPPGAEQPATPGEPLTYEVEPGPALRMPPSAR